MELVSLLHRGRGASAGPLETYYALLTGLLMRPRTEKTQGTRLQTRTPAGPLLLPRDHFK